MNRPERPLLEEIIDRAVTSLKNISAQEDLLEIHRMQLDKHLKNAIELQEKIMDLIELLERKNQ